MTPYDAGYAIGSLLAIGIVFFLAAIAFGLGILALFYIVRACKRVAGSDQQATDRRRTPRTGEHVIS